MEELVGLSEAAAILGVSRQRTLQIVQGNKDFPAPVAELKMGKVYARSAVEYFAEHRNKRNGRPKVGSVKPPNSPLLGVVSPPSAEDEALFEAEFIEAMVQPASYDGTVDEPLTVVDLVPVEEPAEEASPVDTLTERLAYFESKVDIT